MRADPYRKAHGFDQIVNVMLKNLIISVMALHEDFGFGRERIEKYIGAVQEKVKEVDEQTFDGVWEHKSGEYKKSYHQRLLEVCKASTKPYLPEDLWKEFFEKPNPTAQEFLRGWNQKQKHIKAKTAVSMSEAAEMQDNLKAFQQFLRDNKKTAPSADDAEK